MYTVIETPAFLQQASKIWTAEEHDAFIDWIAENPLLGDVIAGTGGVRKVRWAAQGKGKRGGARIIYFNMLEDGSVVLLTVYVKSIQTNLETKTAKGARNAFEKHQH